MRLRDLYKWEKGLDPWVEKESSEILGWIEAKEKHWEKLAEEDFTDITILGDTYDPFDTRSINGLLTSRGLFYGAGYVHSLKPSFFLATLKDVRTVDGYTVYTLGHELARDLLTLPALSQDNCIVLRMESAKLFLWDQIFFMRKSGRHALSIGLENYGLKAQDSEALQRNLARISAAEMESYIYHELGELNYPLFADLKKDISRAYGVLKEDMGVALRGLFIINPEGVIQWVNCNNDATGRNVAEVLRALEATQNPGLTGCDWQPGDATL